MFGFEKWNEKKKIKTKNKKVKIVSCGTSDYNVYNCIRYLRSMLGVLRETFSR